MAHKNKQAYKELLALVCAATISIASTSPSWCAQNHNPGDRLVLNEDMLQSVPIPFVESGLSTARAKPWHLLSDKGRVLEGAILDGAGNLIFSDVTDKRILKLTSDKKLSTLHQFESLSPAGLAFHPDGRIFITALELPVGKKGKGGVFAINQDGSGLMEIVPVSVGHVPDDLVFDRKGGFYFTDFRGISTNPEGGVYYVSPDFSKITPVIPSLAMANGIALSPDGKTLWVTEYARNLLHRAELADETTIRPVGSAIAYHFIGPAPDSMRIDKAGNLYVAMHRQGRIMVFNPSGIPVGQLLIPGREKGRFLKSTSMAISPESNEAYILAGDGEEGAESGVFKARVLATGINAKQDKKLERQKQ